MDGCTIYLIPKTLYPLLQRQSLDMHICSVTKKVVLCVLEQVFTAHSPENNFVLFRNYTNGDPEYENKNVSVLLFRGV